MPADRDVVTNLHLIVDLGALADHGIAAGAAIDRRARTDLDVVLDNDAAELRNLDQAALARDEAEAVLADARPGVDRDTVADERVQDARARPHRALAADTDARTDHGIRPDHRAAADFGVRPDDGTRVGDNAVLEPRVRMHGGAGVDTARTEGRARPQHFLEHRPCEQHIRAIRIGRDEPYEAAASFACLVFLEEAGARRRRAKRVEETRAVEKADVARTRKVERLHAGEGLLEFDRADRLGARERNDLAERDGTARLEKNRLAHTQSSGRPPALSARRNPGTALCGAGRNAAITN